jgi:hypothetical protein
MSRLPCFRGLSRWRPVGERGDRGGSKDLDENSYIIPV